VVSAALEQRPRCRRHPCFGRRQPRGALRQGHRETSVGGQFEQRTLDLPAGSIVVRTDQALGRIVFYLLDRESDDRLTTWNLLDTALEPGAPHPVLKVMPDQRLRTETWP
jgi:hypothetical protein